MVNSLYDVSVLHMASRGINVVFVLYTNNLENFSHKEFDPYDLVNYCVFPCRGLHVIM